MDLFDNAYEKRLEREGPLAARMRPRSLDEFVGQEHIVGPGRLLRRSIQADQLGSLIFYGPPGTGKTTLARVIANTTKGHFTALNAVLAGVKDIRNAIDEARERGKLYERRTILFVDEVHRFNKAQQDALLPWVENGTVIFIGATTENPYFEVNKALVSRSRIFQLTPLTNDHLRDIARAALNDTQRGYGKLDVVIDDEALDHLVEVSDGDARAVLNALELAVETTEPTGSEDETRAVHVTLDVAEESIQRRAVLYDKEGDYHFDTISAFIKSVRGSDPDASLYWLAKMVYAGESPRFIFRRMLILASEDVGMADPNALAVVVACSQAFEHVGLPEGRFHLAQAALYLSTTKKSNTTLAFFDALKAVESEGDSGVPNHLRDPSRDKEGFGHGVGYIYPHAFRDHWVAQQYLPASLQGRVFYQPSIQGYEAAIKVDVSRHREAQLAAMLAEGDDGGPIEMLTFSAPDKERERWLLRTISSAGEQLATIRDHLLDNARVARHSIVLDVKAGSGLVTWEALRRAPEGGVYCLARSSHDADPLRGQAETLPEIERPMVVEGDLTMVSELIPEDISFDAIVGYNALYDVHDKEASVDAMVERLSESGVVSIAESVPKRAQRLVDLVDLSSLSGDLPERIAQAEEAIYEASDDPMVNWDVDDLAGLFWAKSLEVSIEVRELGRQVQITESLLRRWFESNDKGRPTYAEHLSAMLAQEEVNEVKTLFRKQLFDRTVTWTSHVLFLVAGRRAL